MLSLQAQPVAHAPHGIVNPHCVGTSFHTRFVCARFADLPHCQWIFPSHQIMHGSRCETWHVIFGDISCPSFLGKWSAEVSIIFRDRCRAKLRQRICGCQEESQAIFCSPTVSVTQNSPIYWSVLEDERRCTIKGGKLSESIGGKLPLEALRLSGTPVRIFQSRYTIAIVYRLMFSMYRELSRYTPPRPPSAGVSQDHVGIMLLVSQLKLRSRSYRAIGGIAAMLSQIAV